MAIAKEIQAYALGLMDLHPNWPNVDIQKAVVDQFNQKVSLTTIGNWRKNREDLRVGEKINELTGELVYKPKDVTITTPDEARVQALLKSNGLGELPKELYDGIAGLERLNVSTQAQAQLILALSNELLLDEEFESMGILNKAMFLETIGKNNVRIREAYFNSNATNINILQQNSLSSENLRMFEAVARDDV